MKKYLLASLLVAAAALPLSAHQTIGLQLWSVRDQIKANVDDGLAQVEKWGIQDVELASTYGLTAEAFSAKLKAHHLKAVSAHYPYARMESDMDGIIAEARTLGVKYVVVPFLSFRPFDVRYAREVAANLNKYGLKLKANGIKLGYHTHGFEFTPLAGATDPATAQTPFDVLVKETDPDLVTFEMDVYWVWSAGADPKTLLERYPHRWELAHLKDMRIGDARTMHGAAKPENNVAIGAGQIPFKELLPLFKEHHVTHLFIEDETADPVRNIPASLTFLATLNVKP